MSTRVVRLTDVLGRKLFEEAVSGAEGKGKGKSKEKASYPTLSSEDALVLKRTVREQRRRRGLEKRARL